MSKHEISSVPATQMLYGIMREEGASIVEATNASIDYVARLNQRDVKAKKDADKPPILIPDQEDDRFPPTNI